MLTVTDNARAAITAIVTSAEAPEGVGLRIAAELGDSPQLAMSLAEGPAEGDQVLGDSEAPLFVEPQAGALLDGATLDAQLDTEGQVAFFLTEQ